jgi:hypothetical protein
MSKLVVKQNTNTNININSTIDTNEQEEEEEEYPQSSTTTIIQTIEHCDVREENRDSIYSSSLSSSSSSKLDKIKIESIIHTDETHSKSNFDDLNHSNSNEKLCVIEDSKLDGGSSRDDTSSINSSRRYSQQSQQEEEVDATVQIKQLLNDLIENILSNKDEPHQVTLDDTYQADGERFQTFEKLFIKLETKLDDLRAYYIELNDFYELIQNFERFFTKIFSNQSNQDLIDDDEENISMTVDNVLQYFDFLNDADNNCDNFQHSESYNKNGKKLSIASSSSTATDAALETSSNFSHTFITNCKVDLARLFDFDSLLSIHFSNCLRILNVSLPHFFNKIFLEKSYFNFFFAF